MKRVKWSWTLLTAATLLAACKGFWNPPAGSAGTGCTTNCSTATSGNFYILNSGSTPQIVGATLASGEFTSISGSPWTLFGTPYSMAMAPGGGYLYVSTIAGVYVYPVSGGALGSAVQVSQDVAALAIQVDTSGQWLVEALQATGGVTLAAVPLNTSTGGDAGAELTATYPISNAAVQSGKIAIAPDDSYVFVALGAGGAIAIPFNANAAAGVSPFAASGTVIPVANSAGSVLSVAVDPGGNLFYVGETLANSSANSGGLLVFNSSSLGTGTLTQASGSPIASGGLAPNAVLPTTSGYVYVANGQGTGAAGNIGSFSITSSGSTYTVASVSNVAAGIDPFALAEDSSGTFLLAVNSLGSPYFDSYTFDATTAGQLDAQVTANTGASPLAIVAP